MGAELLRQQQHELRTDAELRAPGGAEPLRRIDRVAECGWRSSRVQTAATAVMPSASSAVITHESLVASG